MLISGVPKDKSKIKTIVVKTRRMFDMIKISLRFNISEKTPANTVMITWGIKLQSESSIIVKYSHLNQSILVTSFNNIICMTVHSKL